MQALVPSLNSIMLLDDLTRMCENIITDKKLRVTPFRVEILKCFILNQRDKFSIKEIHSQLLVRKKIIGISTIAEALTTLKARGILKITAANLFKINSKAGRPAIKYYLSSEFAKKTKSQDNLLFCL